MDVELTLAVLQQWGYYNAQLAELTTNMIKFLKNNKDLVPLTRLSMLVVTMSVDLERSCEAHTPVITPDVKTVFANDATFSLMLDEAKKLAERKA